MNFLNNINLRNGQAIHSIERNLILLNHGRGLTNEQITKKSIDIQVLGLVSPVPWFKRIKLRSIE
jgi:hypothetical protein